MAALHVQEKMAFVDARLHRGGYAAIPRPKARKAGRVATGLCDGPANPIAHMLT